MHCSEQPSFQLQPWPSSCFSPRVRHKEKAKSTAEPGPGTGTQAGACSSHPHRYCSATPNKKVALAGYSKCSWCPHPQELSWLEVQDKVVPFAESNKRPQSARSNHLCLAPGSTSCSVGRALVQALQTHSCQWVFRGPWCCRLSELPLKLGVHLASFPQGGHT